MMDVNRADMAMFVEVLFRYCDDGGHASLRTFRDDLEGVWRPELWGAPQIAGGLGDVITAAFELAEAAAGASERVVFAPPVATFKSANGAAEKDILNGPALSIDCDEHPGRARETLENTLGPATVTVASGGVWIDPETGEMQEKVHLHWRLTEPTRKFADHVRLKEARRLATILVGADASAVPLVHPLRWPGSVHRKAKPRLARIVDLRADVEIELGDALAQLREAVAAMRPRQNGTDSGSTYTSATGHQPSRFGPEAEALDIIAALTVIANDERNWKRWSDIGMAVWHASGGSEAGYAAFFAWSSKFAGFEGAATRARWEHFAKHPPDAIGAGTLFHLAREAWPGWEKPSAARRDTTSNGASRGGGDEETGWGGPQPEGKPWPEMDADAFYGPAGDVVEALAPTTEADPVAILAHLLVEAGNAIGRKSYCVADGARHYPNLYVLLVGDTSKGRKGTAARRVEQIMEAADSDWYLNCRASGLSSGEGIIHAVHDEIRIREKTGGGKNSPVQYTEVVKHPGITDKRLLIVEPEFAGALGVMRREGSTLSRVIREAYDSGNLRVLIKNSPERATGAHISIIGHITSDEYRESLDRTSIVNGYANRFLNVMTRRAQELPFGGALNAAASMLLADRIRLALDNPAVWREITFTQEAQELWIAHYHELSAAKPGIFGSIVARGEAHTLRLALLYALLDGRRQIDPAHLRAALAFWQYCEASAKYIFGDALGEPTADAILQALRQHGADGMTRTQISEQLFGRNTRADKIGAALALLATHGKARCAKRSSGGAGRPVEVWLAQ